MALGLGMGMDLAMGMGMALALALALAMAMALGLGMGLALGLAMALGLGMGMAMGMAMAMGLGMGMAMGMGMEEAELNSIALYHLARATGGEMKRKATLMICPSKHCSATSRSCDHRLKHKKNEMCKQGFCCPDCVPFKRKEKKA